MTAPLLIAGKFSQRSTGALATTLGDAKGATNLSGSDERHEPCGSLPFVLCSVDREPQGGHDLASCQELLAHPKPRDTIAGRAIILGELDN